MCGRPATATSIHAAATSAAITSADSDQNRRTNPEAVAAIRGIMNGGVFRVKLDHSMSPLAAWDSAHSALAKANPSLPLPA